MYYFQENYPVATKHYLSSLKALELIGYKNGMAACYGNLGFAYYMQKKYPEAIKYQTLGLNIFNEIGDMQGVASSYSLMGMIYHDQGNYPEVYKNFLASLKIYEDLGDKPNVINALANIAGVYIKQKEYNRAIKYLSKAEKLAKEIGAKSTLQNIYEGYSEADSATGDFKAAYKHFKLYKLYKDSIDNEETRKQTVQSQMTFEFEKKTAISKAEYKGELERQNLIAEEKSKKQKTITWSVIIGLIVVLGFASLIFRSLRITRKQKQIIEIKNKETVLQKDIIEEKHKEITDSINYAERIQRSFLASKTFLDENLKNYFVFFQPKDVVSGDFYWASKLNDGKIILATADSTGHGVPGAIMSILNISSLEKAIEEGYTETADILNHTRSNIIERLKRDGSIEGGKDGMDCSLITFDFITQEMTYSAANNPIWVIRQSFSDACKNELLEFKADKMPVGKHDKDSEPFTQHSFQLQKNDIVYTLTDGLPDQFGGAKGKKFMHKQLKEILIEICNLPMNDQKDIIKSKFLNWKADTEQVDDVLLIGVRI
ncbi:MAG: tetratricopeptide repeat protein [Bacteroidetes bacterium]|nr:tetratricopeptide repeat protein [Bacteroidota bacterium]